jgi:hypothetical protein
MQAYEVEFTPVLRSPLRIADAIRVQTIPAPHVLVGDPATPGKGRRIPLTVRLIAALDRAAPLIARAKVYRDPKTSQFVLGIEQGDNGADARAIVLLSTTTSPPGDAVVSLPKEIGLLARGDVGHARQLLLLWPEGSAITVEDPILEQRHALRRVGSEFTRTILPGC